MGSILVTGAAGFVGSHLCEALVARGERVIGLDNFDPYYDPGIKRRNLSGLQDHPGFTLCEGDVRDAGLLKEITAAQTVDRIIHLAALANTRVSVNRAADYAAVNLGGTVNVLEAAREVGARQTVFISTSSVYGAADRIPFVEDDPADHPLTPYPATKRAAELMSYSYHNLFKLPITVVRLFNVYGPRGRPDMMPYQIARRLVQGQPIMLFNNGQMRRDWTYISDIVAGIIAALDHTTGFNVYNLGRGQPVLMIDFVRLLEALTGRQAVIDDEPSPPSDPPITFASVDKARQAFGYAPTVSVAEGLAKFWDWFKAQPES
jgi:UDP-glucuronate 4-epimerase